MLTANAFCRKGGSKEVVLQEEFAKMVPGDTINYRLKPIDRPINPRRLWKGQVIANDQSSNVALVAVLDKGYEGEREYVGWEQIVKIEQHVHK
jgi:hypothetical protein